MFANCLRHKSSQTKQGILPHNQLAVISVTLQFTKQQYYTLLLRLYIFHAQVGYFSFSANFRMFNSCIHSQVTEYCP